MEKYNNLFKCTPVSKTNSFFQPTHILVHEGEIYRIEVCKVDKRWLASSGDQENISLWDVVKQKSNVQYFRPREKYSADKCDL